jgi:hypothetical protein
MRIRNEHLRQTSILIIILIFSTIPALAQKWEAFSVGLDSAEINCMTTNNEEVFIGTYKKGVFSSDILLNNWNEINNGIDTFSKIIHSITAVNNTIYAGTISGLFVSNDNGDSWEIVKDEYLEPGYAVISSIMSFFDNMIYSDGSSVFLSENKGPNWSLIGSGGIYRYINSFASVGNGKEIFAGTINGLLLSSSDGGKSWEQIHEFPNRINSLTTEANVLIVGTDKGAYLSNNLVDWQPINDGLTDLIVYSIIITPKYLFAATHDGVFIAEKNSVIKWTPFNEGLTNLDVCCLVQSKDYLFAATHSGSVYRLALTPLSVDDANNYGDFSIFPNPAMEYIEIFCGSIGACSNENNIWASPNASLIMIYNTLGHCVISIPPLPSTGSGREMMRIDISHLPTGVYYVRFGSRTQMFVKI